jgi:hypothetical protein
MVEITAEAPAQELISSLAHARRMVRLMAQGIMPAYEAASQAAATLRAVSESDQERRESLRKTGQVLSAITMGIAPSQSNCLEADQQLERLIDSLTSGQIQALNQKQAPTGTPDQLRKHMQTLGATGASLGRKSAAADADDRRPDDNDDESARSSDRMRG